ncbi:MAG TPA: winged helix DNA-binding domain-containing protein [Chloroflexia bacterium]|jgi:hypothetical protein
MTHPDIAHRRLHNQHLTRPDFETPADVVRWFGAVQAQDLLASLYAIGLRMPAATERVVERAIADGTIVRTWPMRGTIHFVPPEDARWMLKLLAHRQNVKFAGMYRKVGLTDEIFARAGDTLARALEGGKQLKRKELYAALAEAGIATGGDQRGLHILGYWAQEGLICLGPRDGKQPTFTLLDEWVPKSHLLEGEEALAALATCYFASHGPATVHDFAWWTGLTITEARLGMKLVERDFIQETVDGRTYWSAPTTPPTRNPGPNTYLLPAYDEFTVAYKDRSAFLDPARTIEAMHGIGPSIIVDGRLVGTWKRTLKKHEVIISVSPLAPLNAAQIASISEAAERYGKFLGLRAILEAIG